MELLERIDINLQEALRRLDEAEQLEIGHSATALTYPEIVYPDIFIGSEAVVLDADKIHGFGFMKEQVLSTEIETTEVAHSPEPNVVYVEGLLRTIYDRSAELAAKQAVLGNTVTNVTESVVPQHTVSNESTTFQQREVHYDSPSLDFVPVNRSSSFAFTNRNFALAA